MVIVIKYSRRIHHSKVVRRLAALTSGYSLDPVTLIIFVETQMILKIKLNFENKFSEN